MGDKGNPEEEYEIQNITTSTTKVDEKTYHKKSPLEFESFNNKGLDYISGTTPTGKFGIPQRTIDILKSRNNSHHKKIHKHFPYIDKTMLPETGAQGNIIRAGLTNDLLKERNYTAFLDPKNTGSIMKKLASTVLVKLGEIDKGTVGHIFKYIEENKDWADKHPDIIIDEMQNAIKQLEDKKTPTLKIFLNLIKETEEILEENRSFQRHRTGNLKNHIEEIHKNAKDTILGLSEKQLARIDINRDYLLKNIKNLYTREFKNIESALPLQTEEVAKHHHILYEDFLYGPQNEANLKNLIKNNFLKNSGPLYDEMPPHITFQQWILDNQHNPKFNELKNQMIEEIPYDSTLYRNHIDSLSPEAINQYDSSTQAYIKGLKDKEKDDITLSELIDIHLTDNSKPSPSILAIKSTLDKLDNMSIDASTQAMGKLGRTKIQDLMNNIHSFYDLEENFPDTHNISMRISSETARNIIRKTNEPPVATLAVLILSDKELLERYGKDGVALKQESEEILMNEVRKASAQNDKSITKETSKAILSKTKEILKNNEKDLFSIFSPHQDKINTQRRYDPRNFTMNDKNNDIALNAIRDAIYMGTASEVDQKNYHKVFTNEAESTLIGSGIDKSILDMRPDSERVNDIQNIILLMEKIENTEIDKTHAKKILESSIFSENTMIDPNNKDAFEELIEDLSMKHEYDNQDEIFGIPDDLDIERNIQHRNYTEAARIITDKLSPSLSFFLQNNQMLVDFSDCMETSKSPTNHVETSPSLAKECFKKLEDAARQSSEGLAQILSSSGAGFSPFTAFLAFAQTFSSNEEMKVAILKAQLQQKIRETTSYVLDTETKSQSNARIMLAEIKDKNYGGNYIKEGFEKRLIETAEEEGTVAEILNIKNNNLDMNLKLDKHLNGDKKLRTLLETEDTLSHTMEKINTNKEKIKSLKLDIVKAKAEIASLQKQYGEATEESQLDMQSIHNEISFVRDNITHFTKDLDATENLLEELQRTKSIQENNQKNDNEIALRISKNEFNLSDMSLNDMERISLLLGKYRDSIYKEIIHTQDKNTGSKTIKSLAKEADRIEKIMPQIHKEILNSNELRTNVIIDELKKDNIDISDDTQLKETLIKDGLTQTSVSAILAKYDENPSSKKDRREAFTKLTELQSIQELTKKSYDNHINGEDANRLHTYIRRIKDSGSDVVEILNITNNHNFTEGTTNNGKTYVMGAYGKEGYILSEAGKLIENGKLEEAEKYLRHTNNNHLSRELTTYISDKQDSVKKANRSVNVTKESKLNEEIGMTNHRTYVPG
ncbi:MAG: Unknown protein [uncultured Sulfurovum sp.]|uniref:Uncharacterized protein n=1 Tax=uncultured Sulfurovum sp. TaxID=269237 RepID=A0A6S6ST52_9BACT|nr:MAG: Unknown protein [uncultured Sulfurovum sp.]